MCKDKLKKALRPLLVVALAGSLAACGSSGNSSVSTITAYVAKGPVNGASCTLHMATNHEQVAGPASSTNGVVEFGDIVESGLMYVLCTGGTYTDEATGAVATAGALRAVKNVQGDTEFIVTPVTEMAVRIAETMNGIAVDGEAANALVADHLGLANVDILSVRPTDLNVEPAGDDAAGWYAIVLNAISLAAADSDGDGTIDTDPPEAPTILSMDGLMSELADAVKKDRVKGSVLDQALSNWSSGAAGGNVHSGVAEEIENGLGVEGEDGVPGTVGDESPPPSITSVSPSTGSETGGTTITISGSNFDNVTSVTVGGSEATSVATVSATSVTAVTPSGAAGSAVDVVVTNSDGQTATASGAFTYTASSLPAPTISSVSPSTGSEAGGTLITISGSNFDSVKSVTVGGKAATSVSTASATSVTAETPSGTVTGSAVDVVVTNSDGQTVTDVGAFTYRNACEDCELDASGCPF